jgi:hypothetical protein
VSPESATADLLNAVLHAEIQMVHRGLGDADELIAAVRASVLHVPLAGEDSLLAGDQDGVTWLYGFTTPEELAELFLLRGQAHEPVRYLTVRGDRLLDVAVPGIEGPGGLAVDVAGEAPMLFPAVAGIVSAEHAIDRRVARPGALDPDAVLTEEQSREVALAALAEQGVADLVLHPTITPVVRPWCVVYAYDTERALDGDPQAPRATRGPLLVDRRDGTVRYLPRDQTLRSSLPALERELGVS